MKNYNRYGYACINETLGVKGISANRRMIKKTFDEKGLDYVSELVIENLKALRKIMVWNADHDIELYRITSDLFPWMSEYEITELPRQAEIRQLLIECGSTANLTAQRVTMHPGPFNVLGSPEESAVKKTVKELNQHAEILDLMGLESSHYYPINIHVGGTYGNKEETMDRFCANFQRLSDSAKRRLVVENDDRGSMYNVKDLYDGLYQIIGTPITFDYHHHRFNTGGLTEEEALHMASETWPVKQLVHYSSCKRTFEDSTSKPQAHADWVYEKIKTYGLSLDVEIEAKAKELAVLDYLRKQNNKLLLKDYIEI